MRNKYLDYFLTPGIEYRGRLFINHNANFLHRLQNNSVYRTCTVKISLAPPGLRSTSLLVVKDSFDIDKEYDVRINANNDDTIVL